VGQVLYCYKFSTNKTPFGIVAWYENEEKGNREDIACIT
jgi:hypothetical protein